MGTKSVRLDVLPGNRYVAANERGDRITLEVSRAAEPAAPPAVGLGPMEALLAALGACTAFDVAGIMAKRRTPLERYRVELSGERPDGATPAPYRRIVVRHVASGEGVTAEALEKAAHLSHEKYCSVAASLDPRIEVVLEARVEG